MLVSFRLKSRIVFVAMLLILWACGSPTPEPKASFTIIVEIGGGKTLDVRVFHVAVADTGPIYLLPPDSLATADDEVPIMTVRAIFGTDSAHLRMPDYLAPFVRGVSTAPVEGATGLDTTIFAGRELQLRTRTFDAGTTYRITLDSTWADAPRINRQQPYAISDITAETGLRDRPYAPFVPMSEKWGRRLHYFEYDSTDGWRHSGYSARYDSSGQLRKEEWLARHADSTIWKEYWPGGALATWSRFDRSNRTELRSRYDQSGELVGEVLFEDRRPVEGTMAVMWANGNVKSTTEYHNGVLHGTHKYWHYDGSFGGESHFENGNGVMKQHYADGTPMLEHPYSNGRKHGVMREWYPNGQPSIIEHFDHGVKDGEYINWYPEGTVFRHALFENGRTVFDSVFRKDGTLQNDG